MEQNATVDDWLNDLERENRVLNDAPEAIDMLDDMKARTTRPTIGWVMRNTHPAG